MTKANLELNVKDALREIEIMKEVMEEIVRESKELMEEYKDSLVNYDHYLTRGCNASEEIETLKKIEALLTNERQ